MLTQLSIHQLRNLHSVNIKVGQCNVFVGANGSGKTSLLESLYLLSRGKSFRHHQPKRYISHHAAHATVHAKFANGSSMAIQKAQDASTILRLDQQTVYVQSALAKQLPTLLIDPSSMDVLEIGSSSRRQLLDWITFHVKPGFHAQWLAYQRLLKQRNTILRQSGYLSDYQRQELAAWDKGLANHAALITHYRHEAFEEWQPLFNQLIEQLLPDYAPFIQLRFSAGYNTDLPLDELLQQRLAQDFQTGYTRVGCHRADIQVLWLEDAQARQTVQQAAETSGMAQTAAHSNIHSHADIKLSTDLVDNIEDMNNWEDETAYALTGNVREQAANVLSRGEKKLLITALRLSQLPLLSTKLSTKLSLTESAAVTDTVIGSNSASEDQPYPSALSDAILPVVLLDDITAELDERALSILLKTLSELSCQIFITSLDGDIMPQIKQYWPQAQRFHVKQGHIQKMTE
uniref:DNA replication and repair protein RecF n=1 Tax=Psychrobacter sp. (strain PRwf-1) TaxID=349106 RepID=A5WBC3_PSYWF